MTTKQKNFTGSLHRTRGDTWKFQDLAFEIATGSLQDADCVVSMEIRRYRDGATIALINSALIGGVTVTGTDSAEFLFDAATTATIDAVQVWYQIKVEFTDTSEVYTPWEGLIEVRDWAA